MSSGHGISREQTTFGWSQGIGACCRTRLDEPSQRLPQGFDERRFHVAQNKNHAGAVVGVGPRRKPQRRVKHMLDPLDDDRPRGIVAECHYTLDAQEPGSVRLAQQFEEEIESGRRQRRLVAHAEGANAGVVSVDVVFFGFAFVRVVVDVGGMLIRSARRESFSV
jgi:hypothetical protein